MLRSARSDGFCGRAAGILAGLERHYTAAERARISVLIGETEGVNLVREPMIFSGPPGRKRNTHP